MIRYCFGWILICFAYTLFGQTPFICKGQYYLSLTKQGDNFSGLYEVIVDRQSGKVKLDTISSNIGLVLNGMGYRVTDNYIYGIDPLRGRLRKVGKEGVAVDLGVPQGLPPNALYYAGDITPDGRYLLVAGIGNSAANLVWIDLEDALFSTKTVLLSDANVRIVDMAFDPYSGLLFAHDLAASRMITIDPTTGIINANFLRQPAVDQLGALFFDVFGNLYGYGSYQSLVQDKFVSIDKITGAITLLGQGPTSTGQDGCACPYSIQLQKEVQPDTATVCTYVNYTFTFYNGSGITNQDVLFSDTLPQGLIWDKIVTLPYKGRVRISERELQISEMEISPGIDSIVARAISLPGTVGKFLNQAALRKLPETLGGQITSDNPDTPEGGDSTPLWVVPLPDSLFANRYQLCVGDSLLVNPTLYGAQYHWDNGSTDRQRWVKAPDSVSFSVYTECVEKTYSFLVSDDLVWVDIPEDSLTVSLGQWLSISNIVYSSSGDVSFEWTTDIQAQLDCASCQEAKVYALQDGYVYIYMYDDNGCIAADSVYVRVVKDRSVYFPNIISPSSLSGNNQFFLSGTETGVRNYHLKMYDRWGNLVFDVHDILLGEKDRGWNGMAHGKQVEEGVYAWIATIYYIDGYTKEVSGDVTVLH